MGYYMATINLSKDLHADAISSIRKYKNIRAKIAELEVELDTHKAVILSAMADNDTAVCKVGGVVLTVTNKVITSTRVDTKTLKALHPEIAKECSTTSTAPRFTIK